MYKKWLISSTVVFFILLIIVLTSYRRPATAGSDNFDVLIFTQHWPQTVCLAWKENSASHNCWLPAHKDQWTIHGVWPSQYHKLGPQFCDNSSKFNPAALKPIEGELQEKWIDIQEGKESYSLWQHEWNKHGTCAAKLEKVNTELKYFKEGLALLSQYDMKNVLAKSNILPGNVYAIDELLDAIEKGLGKRGSVVCIKDKKTGESYIFEIRICFNKQFELINCDGISGYPTNCNKSNNVIYPGEVPKKRNIAQQ
ncbi:ribonuclease Oy [Colletes gigas]|uniref:ribonuclease Oy n=1 Tax=Colletes gigas TaxID=935657 RepID=UPI001C9AC0CA|nr:ribonuclease Oy [Colletes gigas]